MKDAVEDVTGITIKTSDQGRVWYVFAREQQRVSGLVEVESMAGRQDPSTAVVVGAGPAGLVAALMLAKQGLSVKVFERRPPLDKDQAWINRRSYYLMLDQRATEAMQAAGCELARLEAHFQSCTGIALYQPGIRAPARSFPLPPDRTWFIERFQLLRFLVAEADRLFADTNTIQLHYNHAVSALDVAGRTVIFVVNGDSTAEHSMQSVKYDLLVAADGASSRIRAALKEQVPGFTYHVDKSYEQYAAMMYDVSRYNAIEPRVLHFYAANDWANPKPKEEPAGELTVIALPNRPSMFHFALHKDAVPHYKTSADMIKLMSTAKLGNAEMEAEVAKELAAHGEWHPGADRVKCNQLHGPGIVLLGDAGHAVTEKSGQGANSAIEDAHVLASVVATAADLESVPAAYTEARLEDVHALYKFNSESLLSRGRFGWWRYPYLRDVNHMVVWSCLHAIMPRLIKAPAMMLAIDKPMPYSQCRREADWHLAISFAGLACILTLVLRWLL